MAQFSFAPWYRWGPVVIAAAIYLVCTAHPKLWDVGIWPQNMTRFGTPFVDMHSHLAAAQAVADGKAMVGEAIPGDPVPRPFVGPTWLFWFGYLGLGPAHLLPVTMVCLAAFLLAIAWVIRPRNGLESLCLLVALLSPPVMLLVERGNVDLLAISALLAAWGLMARAAAGPRWAGWALVTAFIGFKYYPALGYAGCLESKAGRREKFISLILGLFTTALFVIVTREEIARVASFQYENRSFPFFGSREIWIMLDFSHAEATKLGLVAWFVGAGTLAWLLGPLGRSETGLDLRKPAFVGAASILVFCFISGSSPDYRVAHFLPCLPWLWVVTRGELGTAKGVRLTGALSVGLFLVTPWLGTLGLRLALAGDSPGAWWSVLFLKQFGWWAVTVSLGALLLRQLLGRIRELTMRP
jgi:hypothetical protein